MSQSSDEIEKVPIDWVGIFTGVFLVALMVLIASIGFTMHSTQVVDEKDPLSSVTYEDGNFNVAHIDKDGVFRTASFDTCTVGEQDIHYLTADERGCWMFTFPWQYNTQTGIILTNETLARVGAIQ